MEQRHYAVLHLLGSLSNDDIDAKDDDAKAKSKMNLYSTHKIRNCLNLFSTPMAQAKYAMMAFTGNSKLKYKKLNVIIGVPQTTENLVISHSCCAKDEKERSKDL